MPKRYWENFRDVREAKGLSQELVAERLGITRQGNLPTRELHDKRTPKPATIKRHAAALECQTWQLLDGVETVYDQLRRSSSADETVASGTPRYWEPTEAQKLLRQHAREQASVAATRAEIERKVVAILAELGRLSTVVDRLPGGQTPVARRGRSASPKHPRPHGRRPDRRRPPKTPTE